MNQQQISRQHGIPRPTVRSVQFGLALAFAALLGNGNAHAAASAGLAPASFDFGVQPIGTFNSKQNFILSNDGDASFTVSGTGVLVSTHFLLEQSSCPSQTTLAPGDSCIFKVTFWPASAGPLTGTLTIPTSLGNEVATLNGIGQDRNADVTLSPINFDFGFIAPGASSDDHAFTLTNNGSAALSVTSVANPAFFPVTNNCPGSLPAGSACVFSMHFSPPSLGASSGTLTVHTTAGDAYAGVRGTGSNATGNPPLVIVSSGTASYAGTPVAIDGGLTITDTDSATLASASVAITGNLHADQDQLSFDNDGSMGNIVSSYDGYGTLSLNSAGASATLAQWQTALRAVRYTNTSTAPNLVDRSIAFAVSDGTFASNTATRTLALLGDTSPAAISFTPLSGVARNVTVTSNSVTVSGINTAIPVMVSGGTFAINGGTYTDSAGSVNNGDTITVRQTSSASFNTATTATLTIGSGGDAQSADFTVTTLNVDTAPDAFGFGTRSGVTPGSTQTSGSITPTGFNDSTNISVAGGLYAINGGAFTSSPGTFAPGDHLAVRLTASNQFSAAASVQLTIGGITGSFTVTTVAADTTPDAFSFSSAYDVMPGTTQTSNAITISGLNTNAPVTVSGGSYRINGGTFTTTPGSVVNGDTVTMRQTASASFSMTTAAILTVGGVSADYQVSTVAAMVDPAAFTFGSVNGVEPGSVQTSGTVAVSGTNTASPISVNGGHYAINGGTFTAAAGTVQPGDEVAVRTTASAMFSSTVKVTLTIGATQGSYQVTTLAADTTPDSFTLGSVDGVLPDSLQTSETVTVSGINTATLISIDSGQYRINDGAYGDAPGTVHAGDRITVQRQAPSGFSETGQATLTIGGVSASFAITTTTMDAVPDSFTIPPIDTATPGATVSSPVVQITGINAPTPFTIDQGCLRIDAGEDCVTNGLLHPGDSFQVVVHIASNGCQNISGTVTIGGVSNPFTVTTQCRKKSGGGALGEALLAVLFALGLLRRGVRAHRGQNIH
ncbi:MAG TPA: choice-of-anchor D domain-containing protein [Solimonas sp.]|nr:choice-of-anchor D domain-containing protein [Solimonas sp.]